MRIRIGLLGLAAATIIGCNKPSDYDGDGFTADVDCNDNDANINPDAVEVCDGVDNNCDASIDGEDADGALTFYADSDADGYGGAALSVTQCDAPQGFVDNGSDCDDTNADINPDGLEICDGADNDCDGLVDDEDDSVDAAGFSSFYVDSDADGYGDASSSVDACNAPSGYADNADDCDDNNADANPDTIWYSDLDSDGYGASNYTSQGCEQPAGYVADATDCNDIDAAINPAATEICDGDVDNDCDGLADDADDSVDASTFTTYYADGDTDGYGDAGISVTQCTMPSGYVADGTDCDDAEILANPGETEVCNDGIDNDCSGDAPECGLPTSGTSADASLTLTPGSSGPDYFGGSKIVSGDFNGDGDTDMVVTDHYAQNSNGDYSAGSIEFFYGPISSGGTPDAVIEGNSSSNYLGLTAANTGDLNGDGADELIVGAYYESGEYYRSGTAYVLSGPTSSDTIANVAVASFSGQNTYDYLGYSVGALGDIDGDGNAEIAVGAPYNDLNGSSSGYAYIADATGIEGGLAGTASYEYLGRTNRIDGIGDADGDGYADFIAGAGGYSTGKAYVFYGAASANFSSVADAEATLTGTGSYYAYYVGGGTDLDGDGYDEFWSHDQNNVNVYTGGSTRVTDSSAASMTFSDSTTSYSYFHYSGTTAGDFNADGDTDFVVTDYYYGNANYGGVWVFNGPLSAGSYDVSSADSNLQGTDTYDYWGRSLASGDWDGDGADDLAVGAPYDEAVYIFNGGGM